MEQRQVIISVGREFGSGGHVIAERIAKHLDLPVYDYNLLREVSSERHLDVKRLEQYDELPRNRFASRTIRGLSNSPEENVARMQFDYLKRKAAEGKSYVVVGRCAESVLKDFDCLISIFILADLDTKIERISTIYNLSEEDARSTIDRYNKKRKQYHNYYSQTKWGDSRNYDFSINCSKLGMDETTEVVEDFIRRRIRQWQEADAK